MPRLLRSKRDRQLLYDAAGGKCSICGEALTDGWEADHKVPWKQDQWTNVHSMQALCPKCNRKKGSKHEAR